MSTVQCRWESVPDCPRLETGEVHIWRVPLEVEAAMLSGLEKLLDDEELSRAARFFRDEPRRQFIVGRGSLRRILSGYLGLPAAKIRFAYGLHGKPRVHPELGSGIAFNFTHSRGLALCAVTENEAVGVDIERSRCLDRAGDLATRYFCESEAMQLGRMEGERESRAFLNAWTRKEAYLKAVGKGLAEPLNRVEVSLDPDEEARFVSIAGDASMLERWSLYALDLGDDYHAAVVTAGAVETFRFFDSPDY